jgi:protein-disulfide isomerase
MFANQRALQVPALKETARKLGLDGARFDACLDSGKHTQIVRTDYDLGQRMGVNSTPTIYINGRALVGAQPFEAFKQVIDEELARAGK